MQRLAPDTGMASGASAAAPLKIASGLSDEAIVALICADQDEASRGLELLLSRHRGWILHRCRAYLGNPEDAEDVTQEVLLRVYRSLHGFQHRAAFRTWLHTIVHNQCKTFLAQRASRAIDPGMRHELARFETSRCSSPADPDARPAIEGLLGAMPDGARDILALRYLSGLSLAGIAERVGLSLSATKMRLYRALALGRKVAATIGLNPFVIAG